MVLEFTEFLLQLIQQHGVLAVMLAAVIEEIIVPIPSPVVPMAAGVLLIESTQLLPASLEIFVYIAIPASIASVLSSYFVYSIAYLGGKPVIKKYGRYLDVSWEEVQSIEEHFNHEYEKYYVAAFRSVPIIPLSLVSGAAGLFRMDWKQYGLWSFIGMLPRNFGLALLGWMFKDDFLLLASQIDTLSTAVAVTVAGTVAGFIAYRKLKDLQSMLLERV